MPLLNYCTVTGNKKTGQVALCFLLGGKEASYTWAMNYFREMLIACGIPEPLLLITDTELVLMSTLNNLFPNSHHLLCAWHVNMNVLAKCWKFFPADKKDPAKETIRTPRAMCQTPKFSCDVSVEQAAQPNETTNDGSSSNRNLPPTCNGECWKDTDICLDTSTDLRPQSNVATSGTDESSMNLPSQLSSSSRRDGSGDGGPNDEHRSRVAESTRKPLRTNDKAPPNTSIPRRQKEDPGNALAPEGPGRVKKPTPAEIIK
jgi:hypothetical protein